MPSLQPPLCLITADAVGQVIRDWASQSLSPRAVQNLPGPGGTMFFRTGGAWDCVVAAAVHSEGRLHPVIVFKNPVALWQCAREPLPDGPLEHHDWSWLRRQIMLHNPGLDGLLQQIEERSAPGRERAEWATTTHAWERDVDVVHLADVQARRRELGADDPLHLLLEVIAYADDEARARGERGAVDVTLGASWVSVRDDGRGTDTRVDGHGNAIRKPVVATRDVRFFDADPPVLLPDGRPRRGISIVAAVSDSLTHVNHRGNGSWVQTYREGLPDSDLAPIESDRTTGTTVHFSLRPALDPTQVVELARKFDHVDVRIRRSTSDERDS